MIFFAGAGIVCIIYYVVVILDSGINGTFSLFWLALGLVFEAIYGFGRWLALRQLHVPRGLLGMLVVLRLWRL